MHEGRDPVFQHVRFEPTGLGIPILPAGVAEVWPAATPRPIAQLEVVDHVDVVGVVAFGILALPGREFADDHFVRAVSFDERADLRHLGREAAVRRLRRGRFRRIPGRGGIGA